MKVSQFMLTSLAVVVISTAAIKISTGDQVNYDMNYAVAWFEGEDPCRNDVLIEPTCNNPCDRHALNDGSRVGGCTRVADQKVGCGYTGVQVHDVIKRWICGN